MSSKIQSLRRINIFLFCSFMGAAITLLWLGSHVDSAGKLMGIAVLFALVMVPLYSLLHEAEHGILDPHDRINQFLGLLLAAIFGASFEFIKQGHLGHHRRNRTDAEMFDLYYDHQSRFRRNLFLAGSRTGLFWFVIVLSTVLLPFFPRLTRMPWVTVTESAGPFIYGLNHRFERRAQRDAVITILFHVALFYFLDLSIIPYLMLYSMHAFIWSSQNFVGHAYSERDILNGAHNHTMNPVLQFWYLNFNLHLAHHQNPSAPWTELPKLVDETRTRIPFWRGYLRLWRGVRLTTETAPKSLDPSYEARIHGAAPQAGTRP